MVFFFFVSFLFVCFRFIWLVMSIINVFIGFAEERDGNGNCYVIKGLETGTRKWMKWSKKNQLNVSCSICCFVGKQRQSVAMSCAGQFEASTTPWVNLRHLMSHVPGGEEFKPCLTGLRNKNRKCQVSPAKHTFFRCLKVKSSLLWANGSEQKVQVWKLGERVESWSLILPFRKKLTLKSRPYVLDLKTIVAPEGGGGLNEQIFKSSNA